MALVYLLLVKNGIWYGYKLALVLMISVFAQHLERSTMTNGVKGHWRAAVLQLTGVDSPSSPARLRLLAHLNTCTLAHLLAHTRLN